MDISNIDWKEIVRTVAPTLATALGGPLAGVATQAISQAVLGKPDGTHDEINQAMAAASPDTLLKLKESEQGFTVKMKELGVEIEKVNAGDRDSARNREIQIKDRTPALLAYASFAGFFAVLGLLMFVDVPKEAHDALMLMLGALGATVTGVVQYYFGSSAGSDKKTDMLADAIKTNP